MHYCLTYQRVSCLVSELNKNSHDLHKLVTGTLLLLDVAVSTGPPGVFCTVGPSNPQFYINSTFCSFFFFNFNMYPFYHHFQSDILLFCDLKLCASLLCQRYIKNHQNCCLHILFHLQLFQFKIYHQLIPAIFLLLYYFLIYIEFYFLHQMFLEKHNV